jgi:capsular polysaccharide biosynthesis protein
VAAATEPTVPTARREPIAAAPVTSGSESVSEGRRPAATFVGPLEAMLRHPFLGVLPILLAVGAAIYFGMDRDPVYTADARISVGRADVPAYTLQNVVIGNSTLAAGYARTIDAPGVVRPAARKAGVSATHARDRLAASPIPGSTLIRVEAKGPSEQGAVDLANAGSSALVSYVTKLNKDQEPNDLIRNYRQARSRVGRVEGQLAAANRSQRRDPARVRRLQLDLEVATLEASTLDQQYRGARANTIDSILQVVSPADAAQSDESSWMQRLVLIAAAAGLLIGMTFALLRANIRVIGRRKK